MPVTAQLEKRRHLLRPRVHRLQATAFGKVVGKADDLIHERSDRHAQSVMLVTNSSEKE
jgi:hypothetical protein